MLINKGNDKELLLSVTMDCRAPKRKVFETWTQPEWLKKWFRVDEGFTCDLAEVDLKVGGKFKLAMRLPGQEPTTFFGEYKLVRVPEALVYTWAGGEGDHLTLVTAYFSDRGDGSRIDFAHGIFSSQTAKELHSMGWMACFNMFGKVVES